jgi:hypothetical protein
LGFVWRETGAVRNARPSRGQAASTRKEDGVEKEPLRVPIEIERQCGH